MIKRFSLLLLSLFSVLSTLQAECDVESIAFDTPVQYVQLSLDGQFAVVALENYEFACVNVDNGEVQWQSTFDGYDYQYGLLFYENSLVIGRNKELLYVDLATGEEYASLSLGNLNLEDAFLDLDPIAIESDVIGFPTIGDHVLLRFSDSNVLVNLSDRQILETYYTDFNEYSTIAGEQYTFLVTVEHQVRIDCFSRNRDAHHTMYLPQEVEDCLEVFWVRSSEEHIVASTAQGIYSARIGDKFFVKSHSDLLTEAVTAHRILATSLFAQQYRDMSFAELYYHIQLRKESYTLGSLEYIHMMDTVAARTSLFGSDHAGDTIWSRFNSEAASRMMDICVQSTTGRDTITYTASVSVPPMFSDIVGYQRMYVGDSVTQLATQLGLFEVTGSFISDDKRFRPLVEARLSYVDDRTQGYAWVTGDSLILYHDQQPLAILTQDSLTIGNSVGDLPDELSGFVPTSWYVGSSAAFFATADELVCVAVEDGSFSVETVALEPPMGFAYTWLYAHGNELLYNNTTSLGSIEIATAQVLCRFGEQLHEQNEMVLCINPMRKQSLVYMRDANEVLLIP